ncbi:hypothetical protein V493_02327 [Pseudogymnoascus sp. VKM F-4281 (FW-2241)]|nr:hypothetical protein V493_02327 [Pseudogymnoascus sp. VKM F-4281 (FW-2241)]
MEGFFFSRLSSWAVKERRLKASRTLVVLRLRSAVLLNDELGRWYGVAVRDVAAAVNGVPNGEVEAAVVLVGDGPRIGAVVWAGSLNSVRQAGSTQEKCVAVTGWQDGVADDAEIVAAHGAVGDAVCAELANAKSFPLKARRVSVESLVTGVEGGKGDIDEDEDDFLALGDDKEGF